jgi:methylenetetrahydrofolate dehydrogenase (NADP+)/methenyltetrahydrofolate cyclohydrolase
MPIIFDGKTFASQKEEILKGRVFGLKTRGVFPKLASIIVGDDPASKLYVGLKKKAAERIGAELDIYFLPEKTKIEDLILLIGTLNTDDTVQGIMIQMPLPEKISNSKLAIINTIRPEKDVDGLQKDSRYLHPTSKAVIDILHKAETEKDVQALKDQPLKVVVVGATGMVGAPLVKELKDEGYEVTECNTKTEDLRAETLKGDVVISATGTQGLIKGDMVQENTILIDVGSPKGDFSPVAQDKAVFFTPVPGGVGPVTISCLLENLISAC